MEHQQTTVFEDDLRYVLPASTGLRFANYIVDMLLFYGVFFAAMFIFGIVLSVTDPDAVDSVSSFLDSGLGKLVNYLAAVTVLLIFFTLMEGLSKGRSVGKLITGTIALREDGAPITWRDAFMRSLCRIIPFEAFSALGGHPWHDTLTKTVVTKK